MQRLARAVLSGKLRAAPLAAAAQDAELPPGRALKPIWTATL